MATQDNAREVKPVVMFDDNQRTEPGVKDFRPIASYVENHRGKNDHLGGDLSRLNGGPEQDPDDPGPSDEDVDFAPPEVHTPDEEEVPTSPPEEAPEAEPAEEADGGSTDDDIPSPWDEPTSD